MKITEFGKRFQSEQDCEDYLRKAREDNGVVCKKCGCERHYWNKDKKCWVCKECRHETSLTADTVIHGSKLSLLTWFTTIHLLTTTKNSFSASEMQRQLGLKRYQPVWEMLHKIRSVMGLRDDKYELNETIELDECFITAENSDSEVKDEKLKRGTGSQRKQKVLVMVESKECTPKKKTDKPRKMNHIKMKVLDNLKADTVNKTVKGSVSPDTTAVVDASKSHVLLEKVVQKMDKKVVPGKDAPKVLPWVHISIANAKSRFQNLYHGIKDKYLQEYLNEFCWQLNRRFMHDLTFDRLIAASISYQSEFKHQIYNSKLIR